MLDTKSLHQTRSVIRRLSVGKGCIRVAFAHQGVTHIRDLVGPALSEDVHYDTTQLQTLR